MQKTIEIKHLSRVEKLRIMEAIWEDLSSAEEPVESPDWHNKSLQKTEQQFNAGNEGIVDWQEAKKMLWEKFE